jgi:hypothetical protein
MNALVRIIPKTYEIRPLYDMTGETPWGYGVYEMAGDDKIGIRLCQTDNPYFAAMILKALERS